LNKNNMFQHFFLLWLWIFGIKGLDECKEERDDYQVFIGPFEISPRGTAVFFLDSEEVGFDTKTVTAWMESGRASIDFYSKENSFYNNTVVDEGDCRRIVISDPATRPDKIIVECLEIDRRCLLRLSAYLDFMDYSML
jgi:hypothetical protein